MSLALHNSATAHADWIPLQMAAKRMGCNAGHLRRRCSAELEPQNLAARMSGQWFISPAADPRLRDRIDAKQRDLIAIATLRAGGTPTRYIELAELRRQIVIDFDAFRWSHSDQSPRDALSLYIGVLQHERRIGDEAAIRRLSISQFYEWKRAYADDGITGLVPKYRTADRGDSVGDSVGDCAWADFRHRMEAPGRPRLRDCWRITSALAESHPDDPAWSWPSYSTIRVRYNRDVHPLLRAQSNFGPHKTEAKFLPKIARTIEDTPAGSILCGDQRIMDFVVRVPSARGWELTKPKLTAWIDVRSRMFVGWILGTSANSDTILAAFKSACLATGTLPDEVTIDNGKDYQSVAGRTRRLRKWDEFDSGRINSAFERLGVKTHFAKVRTPWAKMIESHFSRVKDRLDRHMPTFSGGTPFERPFGLYKELEGDIQSVPTLEEATDAVADFFDALHEEVMEQADGMFGLCPRQAMRQYFTQSPRVIPEETLTLMCCRIRGGDKGVRVSRDGVRANNIRYGKWDEDVFDLQGQRVWFLEDPSDASFITLCSKDGAPICKAYADNNLGQTRDEVRAAENHRKGAKRRLKRVSEDQLAALQSTTETVADLRARAARARQIADADLPAPPMPETLRVVRADAEPAVEKVKIAAGSRAIRNIKELNAGCAAMNQQAQRRRRFTDLPSDVPEAPTPAPSRRFAELEVPDDAPF